MLLPLVFTSFSPYKDFVNIAKEKVQPVRKRELRVEMLEGSLDWKTHFHQLGIYISVVWFPAAILIAV